MGFAACRDAQGLAEPNHCRNRAGTLKIRGKWLLLRLSACRHGKPRAQTDGKGTVGAARDMKMLAQPVKPTILPEKPSPRPSTVPLKAAGR